MEELKVESIADKVCKTSLNDALHLAVYGNISDEEMEVEVEGSSSVGATQEQVILQTHTCTNYNLFLRRNNSPPPPKLSDMIITITTERI